MKSHLRASRASGSELRKIERIIAQGSRSVRRQFVAADRRRLFVALHNPSGGGTNDAR